MSIFVLIACCLAGALLVPWEGLGESRAVRWVAVRSRKTVRTCGLCRSEWRVWLETYHGALVTDLRSLDWYRWMTTLLNLVAHPHSSIPYVHTGWFRHWGTDIDPVICTLHFVFHSIFAEFYLSHIPLEISHLGTFFREVKYFHC